MGSSAGECHGPLGPAHRAEPNDALLREMSIERIQKMEPAFVSDAPGPERSWLDRATGAPCAWSVGAGGVETRRARGDVDARGPSRRKVNIPTIPVFHIGVLDGWLARAEIGVALAGYLTLSV
jgi:hypothetical protein